MEAIPEKVWRFEPKPVAPVMTAPVVAANDNQPRGILTFLGEDEPYIPKPELVRDTMPRTGVGFFGGQSGAYKTFFAIHAATCFMTGEPLAGREIEREGGVVYLAAEGEGTIKGRVKARRMRLDNPTAEVPFYLLTGMGSISDKAAYKLLKTRLTDAATVIRDRFDVPLVALIIDTVAAAGMIPEDKENDPGAWQKVFDALQPISTALDCVIILIHHAGKNASAGLRGSSNARAGADFALMLACDRDEITGLTANHFLHLTKSRDAPEGPIAAIRAEQVKIGEREDGSPITSLVLDFDTQGKALVKPRQPSVAERSFVTAFTEASAAHSETVHVHGDLSAPRVVAIRLADVKAEFELRYVTAQADAGKRADLVRKQFKNALDRVTKAGTFCSGFWNEAEWVWKIPDSAG